MKKYDPKSHCPKCGWERASTEYVPRYAVSTAKVALESSFRTEALKRKCHCCGYSWDELPLDG